MRGMGFVNEVRDLSSAGSPVGRRLYLLLGSPCASLPVVVRLVTLGLRCSHCHHCCLPTWCSPLTVQELRIGTLMGK